MDPLMSIEQRHLALLSRQVEATEQLASATEKLVAILGIVAGAMATDGVRTVIGPGRGFAGVAGDPLSLGRDYVGEVITGSKSSS